MQEVPPKILGAIAAASAGLSVYAFWKKKFRVGTACLQLLLAVGEKWREQRHPHRLQNLFVFRPESQT